jgi:predicted metal-dependent hydrolase
MDLPLRLEQGRAAFNRGEYFEAHELWEEAWHELAAPNVSSCRG